MGQSSRPGMRWVSTTCRTWSGSVRSSDGGRIDQVADHDPRHPDRHLGGPFVAVEHGAQLRPEQSTGDRQESIQLLQLHEPGELDRFMGPQEGQRLVAQDEPSAEDQRAFESRPAVVQSHAGRREAARPVDRAPPAPHRRALLPCRRGRAGRPWHATRPLRGRGPPWWSWSRPHLATHTTSASMTRSRAGCATTPGDVPGLRAAGIRYRLQRRRTLSDRDHRCEQ